MLLSQALGIWNAGWSLYLIDTWLRCAFMKIASWWLSSVASEMIVLLCFCGASGGSTLFTSGNPYIIELPRYLIICVDMGIPFFSCAVGFNPLVALWASILWYKNYISGLRSCANQPPWSWLIVKLLPIFGWRNISGLFGTLFCGPQYSAGLLELFHGQAVSFGNTLWVMFLGEYPWRSQVALNPEVEQLHCMCKGCSYIKA